MPRPTMAALIAYVRGLVGDPAPGQDFSDDEIQAALDRTRRRRVERLIPVPEPGPGGVWEYREFVAPVSFWEASAQVLDPAFNPIPPAEIAEADFLTGRVRFSSSRPDGAWLSGVVYDVYLAGAELLEALAARYKADYDFSADGASFSQSQKVKQILAQAAELRRRAGPWVVKVDA